MGKCIKAEFLHGYMRKPGRILSIRYVPVLPDSFEDCTELYNTIFAQVNGLLWKDGGPVVGVQIENESRGPWDYLEALKNIAVKAGFDVPFYTRTGWPALRGKEVFGQLLPLFMVTMPTDSGTGNWRDMPGSYADAFIMRDKRMSSAIATETFSKEELSEDSPLSVQNCHIPILLVSWAVV